MDNLQSHFSEITTLIRRAKQAALRNANVELIKLYWHIGAYLSERTKKDKWGKSIVKELAAYIVEKEPMTKGFSTKNLWRMKQFFEIYEHKTTLHPLINQISWTNNLLIFSKTKSEEEALFYLHLTIQERLDKRTLERHIDSAYFERTVLANKKVSPLVRLLPQDVTNVFKDIYVLEFLNLPDPFLEKDLKKALLRQLKKFILELGKDFIFIDEEFRVQVGNTDFFIDLLFYHRGLCCLVPFELKIEKFQPEFIGKMDFYLEALDRDVKKTHENPSIGVLLCSSKNDEVVEYAMSRTISPILVADYETQLIDKNLLRQQLQQWTLDWENQQESLV